MHLTPKWRQSLLFFCLYNNWPSMPDFKVKILLNSTGVIEEFLKHEASQAFQTWYIKLHEVQMASKTSDVALSIFQIILSFFIMFHRISWMKWQMFRIFFQQLWWILYHYYYYFLIWSFIHICHSVNSHPTCQQRGAKLLREGWWRIKNEELFTLYMISVHLQN